VSAIRVAACAVASRDEPVHRRAGRSGGCRICGRAVAVAVCGALFRLAERQDFLPLSD
jgi:hypothetical protein